MEFLQPLKVKEYKDQKVTVAQSKSDGYYAEVYKDTDGVFICTKGQKINLWPKLKKNPHIRYQIDALPINTILRCELHAFDVPATSVPTMINDADERLLISPFRIELWNGGVPTTGFLDEQRMLTELGFCVPQVKTLDGYPCASSLGDRDVAFLKSLAEEVGLEGWVLKDTPRGGCWKIKPQLTVDAFVTGYQISDSDSFAGGLKSVEISVRGTATKKNIIIADVGSGFEAKYRMSVDPKTLIGRVGEFKYQDIGARGRLKFPRFLRWRDDEKKASECTVDQLKGF